MRYRMMSEGRSATRTWGALPIATFVPACGIDRTIFAHSTRRAACGGARYLFSGRRFRFHAASQSEKTTNRHRTL